MAPAYLTNGWHAPAEFTVLQRRIRLRAGVFRFFLLCVSLLLVFPLCLASYAQERILVVGADNNFPPFEYADRNGVPRGYTIDLIKAVAAETGLKIRVVSGPWADIRRQFDAGQIDILSGLFYSSQRASSVDFTIPHSSVTYSIFLRKGAPELRSEADLRGRSVWVQERDIAFDRLKARDVHVMPVVDEETALAKLAEGQGDAVVGAKTVGLYFIRQKGAPNLRLSSNIFEQQQYCFAVRRNRSDRLLEKLNEGLTAVKYDGTQEQIAAKWLSPWEQSGVPLRNILAVVGVLAGLLLLVFAWSWALRKKVREHTASLQSELEQRLRAEARVIKLNRLYGVINEVNKAIGRMRDRDTLFSEVARLIVEQGDLPLAWVGTVDETSCRLVPVAQAGVGGEYLQNIVVSTAEDSPEGRGPGGTSAREGRTAICNNIADDAVMAPWRSAALEHSYRSCASLPLKLVNKTVAVLTLYASEAQFFDDEEELALLNGVARDISFALEALDREERRKRAESALHQSEERFRTAFEQAAVGMTLCDSETRIQAANSSFCEMLGYSREELIGQTHEATPLTHPEDVQTSREYVSRMLSGELPRAFWEKRYVHKDGRTVWAEVVASVVRDAEARPLHIVTQVQDITGRKQAEADRRQAYETLEAVFRASPIGIVVYDMDGSVLAWNKACERMFGWTAEEVLGKPSPHVPADKQQEFWAQRDKLLSGEAIVDRELVRQRKDGSLVHVSFSAAAWRDAEGRFVSGIAMYTDLTERKRAEEELRRAYETLDAVFRASPLAIMALEDHKYVTLWNQAAEQMYGWKAEEVIGRPNPVVPPEAMANYEELREALLRGEVVAGKEAKGLRKDGTLIDVLYSTAPMRDEQGRFTRGVGMMWDITDRKRAEQELREANTTKETILRASPVALLAHDIDGNVILWNDAAERMFGWTADEVMGRPVPIIPPGQAEEFHLRRERVLQGEQLMNQEIKRLRKDGKLLDVSFSVTPFRDAEGRIKGALGAYLDITERKRLEAQLLQSQKLESIGRLAGGIAHDFNNLLTVINCQSDILLEHVAPGGPVSEGLRGIRKAGEQASGLTRQLLAFSRRQILQPKVLDLNEVVRDISGMLERLLGEDIELDIKLDSAPARVKVDPGQFQQVIMNLAVNARDAMPNGGKLTIATAGLEQLPASSANGNQTNSPQVMLSVSDTGSGMDEDTQRHIFEPFFTTKAPGKGTGLGLSMVWGIVKQSGGHLWVHSEPGKGTTFKVALPHVEEPVAQDAATPGPGAGLRGSERILLVEDQPQLRELTSRILSGYGYNVIQAANGTEALHILERDSAPDLVVTDIVMPGMTGIELGKRVKTSWPDLKLLYMSGYTDDVILRQGALEAGAAYIEKPFTAEGLTAKIRQVLAVPAAGSESAESAA